ncbi:DUF262 domain-containing protein [Aliarcobacter butzleri]|uniref:DUF262 domain-containing protein n=1 Tax=Aliarcobacter butzleri TaxID=28197 RepID=UPI002B253E93|nr:DUF262 domain-containing protein [Aliarcobacter butzleri]
MALSLTAEQKSILTIFSGNNQYIIPPYQRQYSWQEEQCSELFEDLKRAFLEYSKDGYFLGNIIIAKNSDDKNKLEVIDGQQRLITLTLFIKVLLTQDNENDDLKKAVWLTDSRTKEIIEQRLVTNVFEDKDAKYLKDALDIDFQTYNYGKIDKNENNFIKNICYFYNEIKEFSENNSIQEFVDFFLYEVTLLPIETEDSDQNKAREKALKIFETINDRGMSLSDSDIFKAKLYSMALNELNQDSFIEKWKELDSACSNINYKIDDVFKIYIHIIRGQKGIKSSEIGLREFYTQSEHSPFETKDYNEIVDDLFEIIYIVKFYKDIIQNTHINSNLSKWFQLIDRYTNQYPLMALFAFMYKHDTNNHNALVDFSKNLVRFAYSRGSTTRIKYKIYNIIIDVMHGKEFCYIPEEIERNSFEYLGALKNSFSLLCFYLDRDQKAIFPYYFDKILHPKDEKNLNSSWQDINIYDIKDTLGNFYVADFPKKNVILEKRVDDIQNSNIRDLQELSSKLYDWSYQDYKQRDEEFKNRLLRFFRNEN